MKGNILGSRYKVIEYIAEGGFGRTYLAEDTQLPGKELCVIKELCTSIETSDFKTVARRLFKAEASALKNLGSHQQIPELLAYFEESEKFYLVQQYIEGQTLEQELNLEYVWSETKVIELLRDGLKILEFIHSKGVIHRDLKPANLIRRQWDQKIVLVDFGTVKNVLQEHINTGQLTIPAGTRGYMPPEQATGKPRATSDLYALGIIGIQALTKVEPLELEEDNRGELIWLHLAQVSKQLAQILTKMTQYHFEDRYQSASEALQALSMFCDGEATNFQSVTNVNQSLPNSLTSYTKIALTDTSASRLSEALISEKIELSNQIKKSQNQDLNLNNQSAEIDINLTPQQSKPEALKIKKSGFVSNFAIALGAVILGIIYLLMQPSTPESPKLQDSTTPRVNQGEGFRKDL